MRDNAGAGHSGQHPRQLVACRLLAVSLSAAVCCIKNTWCRASKSAANILDVSPNIGRLMQCKYSAQAAMQYEADTEADADTRSHHLHAAKRHVASNHPNDHEMTATSVDVFILQRRLHLLVANLSLHCAYPVNSQQIDPYT